MKNLLIFLLISTTSLAQNKKKQINMLNFRVDSLNGVLSVTRDNSVKEISILNDKIKELSSEINELKISNNNLTNENVKLKKDLKVLSNKSLELEVKLKIANAKLANSSWSYDTICSQVTHTCYYYQSCVPYFISSTQNDSIRKKINSLVRELSFKIPAIMNNEDYKSFRNCENGDYNHKVQKHSKHVTYSGCSWCQSEFYSRVKNIEHGNYLSILMAVDYVAGGNWAHYGYNSLNLKNNEIITIPNSLNVKNLLIEEIKDYLQVNPFIDLEGNKVSCDYYIQEWEIDDLTFYFKSDTLRLIFEEGFHHTKTFDVPLPKLQQYLKL